MSLGKPGREKLRIYLSFCTTRPDYREPQPLAMAEARACFGHRAYESAREWRALAADPHVGVGLTWWTSVGHDNDQKASRLAGLGRGEMRYLRSRFQTTNTMHNAILECPFHVFLQ